MAEQRISKVIIKRGAESRINEISLLHGELAFTDSNRLYIGSESGSKVWINTDRITAEKAEQLEVARKFSITGDGTAQEVSFDGQDDVELNLVLAPSGVSGGTYTKVTVNSKGLVTSAEQLVPTDITGFLDGDDKIKSEYLPALAITDTFLADDEAEMLALDVEKGDIAIRTDLNMTFILRAEPATELTNWQELKVPTAYVSVINGKSGSSVTLDWTDVGAEQAFSKNTAFNKNFGTLMSDVKRNGTPSVGTKDEVARIDHVHGHDNTKADIDNPTFTGIVTMPSVDAASNDETAATTKFVKDQGYATKTYVDGLVNTSTESITTLTQAIEDQFEALEESLLIIDGGTF